MNLRIFSPFFALALSSCGTHAGTYLIEPAPLPKPLASEVAPDPNVTPTPDPVSGAKLYLMPLQDRRRNKDLFSGRGIYEKVRVEPVGLTQLPQVWQASPYGPSSYLLHRQWAHSLSESGYQIIMAEQPQKDRKKALAEAKEHGAEVLVDGEFRHLNMARRGADPIFGTNFTGTNFYLNLEARLRFVEVATGKEFKMEKIRLQEEFHDPKMLGSDDRNTFPGYFAAGLPRLGQKMSENGALRESVGLPTYTPTPTLTSTPVVVAPKADEATPGATATPDSGPYWVNPKTGARVDPDWNFDPNDGTPRSQFILRQPTVEPTPRRATESK